MKKIILISVVTLAWTIISLYGYSNLNNKIDTVSRQMYKIKEYQDGVKRMRVELINRKNYVRAV